MKKVLCLGLTPALQRTLVFERLTIDEVNRAGQVVESAAGKALNTARALVKLGTEALTAGFNGGATGGRVAEYLKSYGVGNALTVMPSETRICTTLLNQADGSVTELVEEAPEPEARLLKRFVRDNRVLTAQAAMLVISGTLPPFAADDFYVTFVQKATRAGVPVVIDSHKAALINVLFERPFIAKLNVREMQMTLQQPMHSEQRILRGMRDLRGMGAQNVVVTQGGGFAYLLTAQGIFRYLPPQTPKYINAIGSGDCVTAGIVHAVLQGKEVSAALRYGLACGSANVECLTPADFDPRRVTALLRGIEITRL